MNIQYKPYLLAGIVSGLIATPVWAADEPADTVNPPATHQAPITQSQSPTEQVGEVSGGNPLYAQNPEELKHQQVLGLRDERLGKITDIVSDRVSGRLHAIIANGGLFGLAASKYAFPIDTLQLKDGKIHLPMTKAELTARAEYVEEDYAAIPEDRPLSEFSAFEEAPKTQ